MNEFVEKLKPYAEKYGAEGGILPALILAQAIHESDEGASELAREANNLFGIKAGSSWNGETYTITTWEWDEENGKYYVQAAFRKYGSVEDSVKDLVKLYQRARYATVKGERDPIKAAHAVYASGYATDPDYPAKLIGIMNKFGLIETAKGVTSMERVSVFELMDRSERNMGAVNEKIKALAMELIKRSYHEGINVQITSGYRSPAEQNRLYAQGRTEPGNIVTYAKAGQSVHNYGYAIDFVLVSADGDRAIWEVTNGWRRVAEIGKQLGFSWGGDWTSFKDYPHLDMGGLSWQEYAAGKRPHVPDVPERSYLGPGDAGPAVKELQADLNKVGFNIAVDGLFGPGTEATLKIFQKQMQITADGFFGNGSKSKMDAAIADAADAKPEPIQKPREDDDTMEKLIVVYGSDDLIPARRLSGRLEVPFMMAKDTKKMKAKEVILIGGAEKDYLGQADKITVLAGDSWFDTVAEVDKFM